MNLLFGLRQEDGPFGLVGGQRERPPVGARRLVGAAEPGEQVGPGRASVTSSSARSPWTSALSA